MKCKKIEWQCHLVSHEIFLNIFWWKHKQQNNSNIFSFAIRIRGFRLIDAHLHCAARQPFGRSTNGHFFLQTKIESIRLQELTKSINQFIYKFWMNSISPNMLVQCTNHHRLLHLLVFGAIAYGVWVRPLTNAHITCLSMHNGLSSNIHFVDASSSLPFYLERLNHFLMYEFIELMHFADSELSAFALFATTSVCG